MKKCLLLILLSSAISFATKAQVMANRPVWVTIKSANLHCWTCRELLDRYLLVENKSNMDNGMINWTYNLINGEIRVQYLPDRVNIEDIRTAMNNAGFDADTAKAEPSVYRKLPLSCKLAADGGGPKKGQPCHIQPN